MALARLFSTFTFSRCTLSLRRPAVAELARRKSSSGLKVALLTPGPISDQSWNGGAYQGLMRIQTASARRSATSKRKLPLNSRIIFGSTEPRATRSSSATGSSSRTPQSASRRSFRRRSIVTTSGTTAGPNLAGMAFGFADASYLAGILAASVTKTNKLGVIGGTELPPVVESFRAFQKGAREVNPSIEIVTSYIGNWDDVSAGKEQALAQISHGVDVIFQNADAAGLGVFQAARERKSALVIGSNSNQNGVAPDVTLGSVVIDLPLAFLTIAKQVKAGTFKPGVIELGESSHVVMLVLNPSLAQRIPPAARTRIDSLQAKMLAGQFTHVARTASRANR